MKVGESFVIVTMAGSEINRREICPYNPSHNPLASRMQIHLVRCRAEHPNAKMSICIYNATHRIPEPELKSHLANCQDRKNLDKHHFVREDVEENKFPLPDDSNITYTEIWADNAVAYDPKPYCETNPIIRTTSTLSAAKRRDFKFNERKKHQELEFSKHKVPLETKVMPLRTPTEKSEVNKTNQIQNENPYDVKLLLDIIDEEVKNLEEKDGTATDTGTEKKDETQNENESVTVGANGARKKTQNRGRGNRLYK